MAVNPLATAIVIAAGQADAALVTLKAALASIADNERQLLAQLGGTQQLKLHIMGRAGLAGIAIGKVAGTTPDTRSVQQIAQAAWADQLV